MQNFDVTYRAAIDACKNLTLAMLEQTRFEEPATLAAIEKQVADGCALQLLVDIGTGRVSLNLFDGSVSVQVGVAEADFEVWTPPSRN